MKIKMLETIEMPNGVYSKDKIYDSNKMIAINRVKIHKNLYQMFVKLGYAEEIIESKNNFKYKQPTTPCIYCINYKTSDCPNCVNFNIIFSDEEFFNFLTKNIKKI